jgi:hypothetical protein
MRFTAVVNLPVIVFVLAVGAAALPGKSSDHGEPFPKELGPSHYFSFLFLCFQHFVASIELEVADS